MEEDDDGPPMLVSADGTIDPAETALSAEMEDIQVTKVPITIITGRHIHMELPPRDQEVL